MARTFLIHGHRRWKSLCRRFQQPLKLNVPWNRWNMGGCVVVFLFAFFTSSIALAFEDDGSWVDGKFYAVLGTNVTAGYGPTVSAACSDASHSSETLVFNDSGPEPMCGYYYLYDNRVELFQAVQVTRYNCGTTTSEPKVRGGCWTSPSPVNNCPVQGEVKRVAIPINGKIDADGNFIGNDGSTGEDFNVHAPVENAGCKYVSVFTYDFEVNPDQRFGCVVDTDQCYVYVNYASTGEPVDPAQVDDVPNAHIEDDDAFSEDQAKENTQKDTTDLVVESPVVVNDPDGSSSVTEKQTETMVKGDGQTITETTETVTLTDTDGIIKVVTTTVNTVTSADGSKTVTTDQTTSYTQTPVTNYTIDKSTGTTVITASGSSTGSSTTTTTDTFDSSGNQTGSSSQTTSEGAGDGEGEDQEEKGFCEENPNTPDCKEYDGPVDGGQYTKGDLTFSSVLASFQTRMKEVPAVQSLSGFFDLNISGSCQPVSLTAWVFVINFDALCSSTFMNILPWIAAVLLAAASYVGFRIAFL